MSDREREVKTQMAIDLGLIEDWQDMSNLPCWVDEMLENLVCRGWRKP